VLEVRWFWHSGGPDGKLLRLHGAVVMSWLIDRPATQNTSRFKLFATGLPRGNWGCTFDGQGTSTTGGSGRRLTKPSSTANGDDVADDYVTVCDRWFRRPGDLPRVRVWSGRATRKATSS